MILTIDVGNTNVVIVGFSNNGEIRYQNRIETYKENISNQLNKVLAEIKPSNIEAVILSNVVAEVYNEYQNVFQHYFKDKVYILNALTVQNFDCRLTNPLEIGADFIATSYGAYRKYKTCCIVADIGSATKVSLTNNQSAFMGGMIIPGLYTSYDALLSYIPHLPEVTLEVPENVIGNSTEKAIQSGLMYGLISQIEGLADKVEQEANCTCTKILTGGLSNLIYKDMLSFKFEPLLLNEGLLYLYLDGKIKKTAIF